MIGIGADASSELLYRDLMRIEHTAGNRSGLHTTITRIHWTAIWRRRPSN